MTEEHTKNTTHGVDDGENRTVPAKIKILCSVELKYLNQTNNPAWYEKLQDDCIIIDADWIIQGKVPNMTLEDRKRNKSTATIHEII